MKYAIVLVLGLVLGGGGAIYLLGVPRSRTPPGRVIQPPSQGGNAAGTAVIMLDEKVFDEFLASIFRDLGSPSFQLSRNEQAPANSPMRFALFQGGCTNTVTLLPEGNNVKTRVQFTNGKIAAPLAFSGSYNLVGNCMQIKGWAQTNIQLSFDQSRQTVYGQLNVEGVNLEGVNPMANNFVTVFVQNALNQRVNPLELLRAPQLDPVIPIKASGGVVKAQVKDVRAEVLDGSLRLHVTYGFNGEHNQQPQG